jgi:hypothetical protein
VRSHADTATAIAPTATPQRFTPPPSISVAISPTVPIASPIVALPAETPVTEPAPGEQTRNEPAATIAMVPVETPAVEHIAVAMAEPEPCLATASEWANQSVRAPVVTVIVTAETDGRVAEPAAPQPMPLLTWVMGIVALTAACGFADRGGAPLTRKRGLTLPFSASPRADSSTSRSTAAAAMGRD